MLQKKFVRTVLFIISSAWLLTSCATRGAEPAPLARVTEATANQSREELLGLIVESACAERLAQLVAKAGAVWRAKSAERASFLQAALAEAEEELGRMRAKQELVTIKAVAFEESALVDRAWHLIEVTYRVKYHGVTVVDANSRRTENKKWISAEDYKLDSISSSESRLGVIEQEARKIVAEHTVVGGYEAFLARVESTKGGAHVDESIYEVLTPEEVLVLDRIRALYIDMAGGRQNKVWSDAVLAAKRRLELLQTEADALVAKGSAEMDDYYKGTKWFDLGGRFQWRPGDPN